MYEWCYCFVARSLVRLLIVDTLKHARRPSLQTVNEICTIQRISVIPCTYRYVAYIGTVGPIHISDRLVPGVQLFYSSTVRGPVHFIRPGRPIHNVRKSTGDPSEIRSERIISGLMATVFRCDLRIGVSNTCFIYIYIYIYRSSIGNNDTTYGPYIQQLHSLTSIRPLLSCIL